MKYYIAQNHDYIDESTVKEFKERCPEGYVVKKDYYDSLLNNADRGKWFFYYYCEDGVSINDSTLKSFFSSIGNSIGFVSSQQQGDMVFGKLQAETREKLKAL